MPDANPYRKEALESLAAAVILHPERKKELEGNREKWVEAYTFYCKQNEKIEAANAQKPGSGGRPIPAEVIGSQVKGIDFNHPIMYGKIPPADGIVYENAQKVKTPIARDFTQFQAPTTEGKLPQAVWGNYWTVPGVTPEELGLSPFSRERDPKAPWQAAPDGANVRRTAYGFSPSATAEPVDAIFSTASSIVDNWSRREGWHPGAKVVPVLTPGGGLQIFAPLAKMSVMELKPGQEKQLTQEEKYQAGFDNRFTRQPSSVGFNRQLSETGASVETENQANRSGPRKS